MWDRLALLLHSVTLGRACAFYFLVVPFLLPRRDDTVFVVVYFIGYLIASLVVFLAVTEKLSRFSDRIRISLGQPLLVVMAALCLISVLINVPGFLLLPAAYFNKYLKLILPVLSMLIMANIWSGRDLPMLFRLVLGTMVVSIIGFLVELIFVFPKAGFEFRAGIFLFDDPNKFALFLNICYAILFPRVLKSLNDKRFERMSLVGCFATLFILLFTQSRSGMITWMVVTALCVLMTRDRRIIVRFLFACIPVIMLFALIVLLRYSGPVSATGSDMGRIWTYIVGWNVVQDHPITGVGYANVVNLYDQYGPLYEYLIGEPLGIHNTALEITSELGVVGLAVYLATVFVPIWILLKRGLLTTRGIPALETTAASIPLIFFTYGLFYPNYLSDDYFWIYMVIPLIVLKMSTRESPQPQAYR